MIKYLSAIIILFILVIGPMSSNGMAMIGENDEEKSKGLQSKLAAVPPSTAKNSEEDPQISLSPLSFSITPQMKEGTSVNSSPSQLSVNWL